MKGIFRFFLFLFFSVSYCNSQPITFKESLGGIPPDYGYSICQTYDHGYVAVGSTASYTYGETDVYAVKIDSVGNVLWYQRHFGSPNIEIGRSIDETTDSSFIVTGFTDININAGYDVLLLKLSKNGDSLWFKTLGGSQWDFGYSIHQTADKGYIIAGGTYSYGAGNEDMWLIKTDVNGDTVWTKTYGGRLNDEARSVRQTKDGGYILTGTTHSFGDSLGAVYVVKTDNVGDTLWTQRISATYEQDGTDIIECANGDFALCGRSFNDSGAVSARMLLARLHSNGQIVWVKYFGQDSVYYNSLESIVERNATQLVAVGTVNQWGQGGMDGYMLHTDATGNFESGYTYGTSSDDGWYSQAITKDNGYILCGYTDSTSIGFGNPNLMIQKTDTNGLTTLIPFLLSSNNNLSAQSLCEVALSPNPFSESLKVSLSGLKFNSTAQLKLVLCEVLGKQYTPQYNTMAAGGDKLIITINRNALSPGVYILQYLISDQLIGASKVIVQ